MKKSLSRNGSPADIWRSRAKGPRLRDNDCFQRHAKCMDGAKHPMERTAPNSD